MSKHTSPRNRPSPSVKKPSPSQLRDIEVSHEVRELSGSELNYRMTENADRIHAAERELSQLDARRRELTAAITRLSRDRAVLRYVIDVRSTPLQLV